MRSILFSILWLTVSALPADCQPFHELTKSPDVMAIFAELLHAGRNGLRATECAAFIVRDGAGRYRAVLWPPSGQRMKQTYWGTIPPGTIAIAHTHPKGSRRPSRGDDSTALALGLPVFVLTPLDIWVATPGGESRAMIRNAFWPAGVARRTPPEILQKSAKMHHETGRSRLPDEAALDAAAPGSP